ncbi:MAG: DUF2065 domain-containing protein [Gammaproteobacteria bacterium]|nr:DUF2065 domain-containing protein [Gammaproteobacteria bacterium]
MISWQDLGAALALVLIFEGMLPFLSPGRWRRTLEMIRDLNDGQLRNMGLFLIAVGALLLYITRF